MNINACQRVFAHVFHVKKICLIYKAGNLQMIVVIHAAGCKCFSKKGFLGNTANKYTNVYFHRLPPLLLWSAMVVVFLLSKTHHHSTVCMPERLNLFQLHGNKHVSDSDSNLTRCGSHSHGHTQTESLALRESFSL